MEKVKKWNEHLIWQIQNLVKETANISEKFDITVYHDFRPANDAPITVI